jgi:hypothetical protein
MQTDAEAIGLGAQSHGQSLARLGAQYTPKRAATLCPDAPQSLTTRSGPLAATTYAPYVVLIDSLAIKNTTQLIENKQSAPFLIDSNFVIFRPINSCFEGTSPRPANYYSLAADHHLRFPCASIARGGKMKCSRTRRTYRIMRYNQ